MPRKPAESKRKSASEPKFEKDLEKLEALVESLEARMDAAAEENPNPGGRSFQRLNQSEYATSIQDLLGLEIDAGAYLPPDTKSANWPV